MTQAAIIQAGCIHAEAGELARTQLVHDLSCKGHCCQPEHNQSIQTAMVGNMQSSAESALNAHELLRNSIYQHAAVRQRWCSSGAACRPSASSMVTASTAGGVCLAAAAATFGHRFVPDAE